jgi:glycosyltransferase involved in cell wall biosynthesis
MRIALVISSLEGGGAERAMSTIANYWAARDQEVTILTLGSEAGDWYELHPAVRRVGLNLLSNSAHLGVALRNNFRRVRRLRRELRKARPDVVISFVDRANVLTLLASIGLGVPVIVSERTDPRQHSIGFALNGLRRWLYPRASAVVMQSRGLRDWACRFVRDSAIHIIPNPVKPVLNGSKYPSSHQDSGRTVVAMGRLGKEKRFDLLLRAFCRCTKMHDDWSLIILGEGDERESLEALIGELELKDRVSLPGRIRDPAGILQGADLFVLSSRYEGFPNALLEAMACGLAVISTDCGSGPREIIRDDVDGLLVPSNDLDALATAMERLMADPAARERLGAHAAEVLERFSMEKIMSMWDDLLARTCRRKAEERP